MPNLAKHAQLVNESAFRTRVEAAAVQAAVNVSGESTNQTDAKSMVRQMYAQKVLNGQADLTSIVWAVAANPSLLQAYSESEHLAWTPPVPADQSTISDGDIEYTISTVWDDLSGAAKIPVYVPAPTPASTEPTPDPAQ
jgi:hypothetical protein